MRSDGTGYTFRSSTSSGHTYDTTPEGARFPEDSDDETIREEGEVPSDVEDDFRFQNFPVMRRWEESDDSGDEGERRNRRNVEYSPESYGNRTPEHERYIDNQRQEIRNLKRKLEESRDETKRVEFDYRQARRAKHQLQFKLKQLEEANVRKDQKIDRLYYHKKILTEDNEVLVKENDCLSDVAQQYFHSKEDERRCWKNCESHLKRKRDECSRLKSEMRIVKNRDHTAKALEVERKRADNYRKLMLKMSAVLDSDAQNGQEADPLTWKTCEICVRQYSHHSDKTPRVLIGCGHTICHSCVLKLEDQGQEEKGIRCPFDRTLTIFPEGSPDYLPKNYALLRV